MFVEFPGFFVDRVDHHGPYAHNVRGFLYPFQGIEQKSLAEPFSLVAAIYCQAGEQYDSHWVIGQPFRDSLGALTLMHRPCG